MSKHMQAWPPHLVVENEPLKFQFKAKYHSIWMSGMQTLFMYSFCQSGQIWQMEIWAHFHCFDVFFLDKENKQQWLKMSKWNGERDCSVQSLFSFKTQEGPSETQHTMCRTHTDNSCNSY